MNGNEDGFICEIPTNSYCFYSVEAKLQLICNNFFFSKNRFFYPVTLNWKYSNLLIGDHFFHSLQDFFRGGEYIIREDAYGDSFFIINRGEVSKYFILNFFCVCVSVCLCVCDCVCVFVWVYMWLCVCVVQYYTVE